MKAKVLVFTAILLFLALPASAAFLRAGEEYTLK